MRSQIELLLERGVEKAQAGERERARRDFIRVIELHQSNKEAWLWLSKVTDDPADRIVALKNVLTLEPHNEQAAAELRRLRRKTPDDVAQRSLLPLLEKTDGVTPLQRLCPHCGFQNPRWAFTCDRCSGDLQPVDPTEALGPASRPRQATIITVLEAWLAAISFDRQWMFVPEVTLASWGRSLTALVMAALFSSGWQALTSIGLQLLSGGCDVRNQLVGGAFICGAKTALLTVSLALGWLPLALTTWLVGGRQGFKSHAHLTAIAISSWFAISALVAPLPTLLSEVVSDEGNLALVLEVIPLFLVIALATAGIVWLIQAIQTAQRLSATRAMLITLFLIVLGLALFYGLDMLAKGRLLEISSTALTFIFLPWPG